MERKLLACWSPRGEMRKKTMERTNLLSFRGGWQLLKQTVSEWTEDKVPQLGAALAFHTALSIAPLLVISLAVAALVFDEGAARGQIVHQMQSMVGAQGAEAIEDMIASAS